MNETIVVTDLCKSFRGEDAPVDVIRHLDFALRQGAFEAVMGPSGSGKSTFLHLVAGLLSADAGSILVEGRDVARMGDAEATVFRRRRIGLVFQEFNLVPTLTAEENAALPLLLDRRRPDPKRLDALFELLGIAHRRRHLPARLSGGERQRVAIARALVADPAIVLADEPTGNLDSPAARDLCRTLRAINAERGATILLVSHDPVVAASAARVRILRDGRFLDAFETGGDPERVSARYVQAMRA